MPQIEPKLTEIRNDLSKSDKNTPALEKKLDDVARPQKSVLNALTELNKELDPSARMEQQRAKLREMIDQQKNLQNELEKLKAEKDALDAALEGKEAQLKKVKDEFEKRMKPKFEKQKALANEMRELVQELKATKQSLDNIEDKENADKIRDALKITGDAPDEPKVKPKPAGSSLSNKQPKTDAPISKRMNDAARQLDKKDSAPPQVLNEQKEIVKDLERALEALEGRQADITKREIQKRKDAEKDISKLQKELKQLQDETKKVEKIEDKEERLKKKEELAAKTAKLQEKMQEMRRQLARLEEKRAEDRINEADNDLDKAQELTQNNGGDPGESSSKPSDELKQAKEELKQAEEALARELLIKIADQLEGLKKRQEALVERSETLHAKVMKRKSWSEAFIDTLDGNADTQKGIADETDSFKEKLKGAKVFHNILERAKESMDKASETMLSRKTDLAVDRRYLDQGDGKQMDAMEIADEVEAQSNTLKHQKQAAKRLAILLDSIKQELAKKPKKKNDQAAQNDQNPDEPPPEQKGGIQAGDGIPPMAQLKALRAEQLDFNQRTEEFAKRHPDTANLNERQLNELRDLEQEQERLESLFQQLTTPPQVKEGEQP